MFQTIVHITGPV